MKTNETKQKESNKSVCVCVCSCEVIKQSYKNFSTKSLQIKHNCFVFVLVSSLRHLRLFVNMQQFKNHTNNNK